MPECRPIIEAAGRKWKQMEIRRSAPMMNTDFEQQNAKLKKLV
jgi:hypothetical protein